MTPNLRVLVEWTINNYGPNHIGIYKCRHISDSQSYSQHSWRNAGDIWGPVPLLDEISAALDVEFGEYIRYKLWRRKNHWNHIHVDMWPYGYFTPPCAGGHLRIKYEDGTVTHSEPFPLTIKEDDLAILTDEEQQKLQAFLGHLDDIGSNVSFVKYVVPWFRNRAGLATDQELEEAVAGLVFEGVDQEARDALRRIKDII